MATIVNCDVHYMRGCLGVVELSLDCKRTLPTGEVLYLCRRCADEFDLDEMELAASRRLDF